MVGVIGIGIVLWFIGGLMWAGIKSTESNPEAAKGVILILGGLLLVVVLSRFAGIDFTPNDPYMEP